MKTPDPYHAWKARRQRELDASYAWECRDAAIKGLPIPERPSTSRQQFHLEHDMTTKNADAAITRLRARMAEDPAKRVRYIRLIAALQQEHESIAPFRSALIATEELLAELDDHEARWRANGSHTEQGIQEMLKPKRQEVHERLAVLRQEGVGRAINKLAEKLRPELPPPVQNEADVIAFFERMKPTERTMALHRAASGDEDFKQIAVALLRPENQLLLRDPLSGKHRYLNDEARRNLALSFVPDAKALEQQASYARYVDQYIETVVDSIPSD